MNLSFISCNDSTQSTEVGVYTPNTYYTCDYIYDTLSNDFIFACFWSYYSNDGESIVELDLAADVADSQALMLERNAEYYAEKFSLSTSQSFKVAQQVLDLSALEERSLEDIADFAKKLYGIDTTKAISAAGKAQMGDYTELDAIVNSAAKEFKISSDNMKGLLQELHGTALRESGVHL